MRRKLKADGKARRVRGAISSACAFLVCTVISGMLVKGSAGAEGTYRPPEENLKARREFQDAKFGMFIHWGVYSVLGEGEWVFHNRRLKLDEYNRLPNFFDPE